MSDKKPETEPEYIPLLKRIADSLQDLVKTNKAHKDISEKQLRGSMGIWEQRGWTILQVLLILIGLGILSSISLLPTAKPPYALDVTVNPDKIMLNQKGDINFEFKLTNVGINNISGFKVTSIELYRLELGEYKFYRKLDTGTGYMACNYDMGSMGSGYIASGKSCTFKGKMFECANCFDDREKQVLFIIRLETTPPTINDKEVYLTIY